MNKNEEIEKLKQVLMDKIKSENDSRYNNLSSDEIMKIIINSSSKGKYVLWLLREYIKGNIQKFEDIEARCKQALILFKNNLNKFTEQQKQLSKMSFQELEALVAPYQDVLTQNVIKRMNKEKIWQEIDIIYEGPEGRIYVPKTEQASVFLGQGTRWCTAAVNCENMFDYYNRDGELYVFVLNKKDEKGRETKYQLHFESEQFMDVNDDDEDIEYFSNKTGLLDKLFENLSHEQKIKYFVKNNYFFGLFHKKEFFENIYSKLIIKKIKTYCETNFIDCLTKKDVSAMRDVCDVFVGEGGLFLQKVPHEFFTDEIIKKIVAKKGSDLAYIPDRLITQEICEIAVQKDSWALACVPKKFKTEKLCKMAVAKNGYVLEIVPDKLKTSKVYKAALGENANCLDRIPEKYITYEICKKVLGNSNQQMRNVPPELITEELCKIAVEGDAHCLNTVPKEFLTYEFYEWAVKTNGTSLVYVPKEYLSYKMYKLAVIQDGYNLQFVPLEHRNAELCNIAVKNYEKALAFVPDNLKTPELCETAIKNNGIMLLFTPDEFITSELCEIAVSNNGAALEYIPKELKTKQLCETAVKNSVSVFEYIPDEYKTKEIYEIFLNFQLKKNNLNYSFDEAIKMMFAQGLNEVNQKIKFHAHDFVDIYLDQIIPSLINEIENNNNLKISQQQIT